MTTFNEPQHQTEEAARQWFESLRWPDGVVCPHCGSVGRAYARSKPGLYRCAEKECRKDFTVRTKSVLESSHIPLRLWAQAFTLLCSSKKGMSAHQVHRTLKITYKSAWFLCHRIREAMRTGGLGPLGGEGKIVEADETYYGPVDKAKARTKTTRGRLFTKSGTAGPANKRPIVALVERGGNVRTFMFPLPIRRRSRRSLLRISFASHVCIRMKASSISMQPMFLPHTKRSIIHRASTSVMKMAAPFIPIQRKATSRFLNAVCAAITSTAKRSICTGTWLSLISATIIVSNSVSTMATVRRLP